MTARTAPAAEEPVRVLVVEDSPVDTELVCRMLRTHPGLRVVATAGTGRDALVLVKRMRPNVMILDLNLPDMVGLDLIEELMAFSPLPIIVLSTAGGDKLVALEALARGAVEVMGKPEMGSRPAFEHHAAALARMVAIVARSRVITHPRGRLNRNGATGQGVTSRPGPPSQSSTGHQSRALPRQAAPEWRPVPGGAARVRHIDSAGTAGAGVAAIGLAASTGGPQALRALLSGLSASLAVPVLVVQHIAEGFTRGLVDWLHTTTALPVAVARHGDMPAAGHVYLADEGRHLELRRGRLVLSRGDPVSGHCPSADVMLASMASDLGDRCLAVVLTGMGRDGAVGARAVHEAGGAVIAQDQATSAVFGMPRAVVDSGAADAVLPLHQIAPEIIRRVEQGDTG